MITNGQLDGTGRTRYDGDATIDLKVSRDSGWIGVIHDIRRGLIDGQHQVVKLGLRPLVRPEPLPEPISKQRQRCRCRGQYQLKPAWGSRLRLIPAGCCTVSLLGRLAVVT